MRTIINAIHYLQNLKALQIFTIYLRFLLGGTFIIAAIGMGKLTNEKLPIAGFDKPIQDLEPIQLFFRAMIESGLYWNFIGWSQIIIGVLLMTQRFAALGSALFFGMAVNIFIITLSYDFNATPIITGLMLLASIYLILWEIDKWQFFFRDITKNDYIKPAILSVIEKSFWIYLGLILLINIFVLIYFKIDIGIQILSCIFIGFVGFIIWLIFQKRFQ